MNPSTLARMGKVIAQTTGIRPGESFNNGTPLVGSGLALDSVAVVELLVGLEREFGVEILAAEVLAAGALRTVGTLTQFIESKLDGAS